jgi:hypothetical protein
MAQRTSKFALFLAAASMFTIPALAAPGSNDTVSTKITVGSNLTVASKSLAAGDYKVVVEGSQAKFMQGNKTVAEVPCTLKTLPNKAQHSDIVTDHGQLIEIDVSGKNQAINFGS